MTGDKEKARRLTALFLLGSALFTYPVISLFNLPVLVWGVPLLYAYVFIVWAVIIFLIALVMHKGSRPAGNRFSNRG
ncbi:MAG: hypothetical protein JRG88_00960 [Deltaproteobacteria bacterium]|nr:hypothetical protein [Deltaproteobacteria bacterium]